MAPRFLTLLALLPLVFAKVEVPQPAIPDLEDSNGECPQQRTPERQAANAKPTAAASLSPDFDLTDATSAIPQASASPNMPASPAAAASPAAPRAPVAQATPAAPAAPETPETPAAPAAFAAAMVSAAQAQVVLTAAVKKATDLKVPQNIAVTDPAGHLVAFMRMDGAMLVSVDVAQRKARTVSLFSGKFRSGDLHNGEFIFQLSQRDLRHWADE